VSAPLKLIRQKSAHRSNSKVEVADHLPVAAVLVNTPVSHLEGIYDYLVPAHLESFAQYGTTAVVPFSNSQVDGLIIARKKRSPQAKNLKMIIDITSPCGLISTQVMGHLELVRNRFGGSLWNLLKSAIPPRVLKEYKNFAGIKYQRRSHAYESPRLRGLIGRGDYGLLTSNLRLRWAINLPIGIASDDFITEIVKVRAQIGQVLLIVPDDKDLLMLKKELKRFFSESFLELGAHLGKSERYRNFLSATFSKPSVILCTRSGVFTSLEKNSTVMVLSDLDQSHYEQHSPGWNTRDVSLLRSNNTSLFFISASHSLEISRLVQMGWFEKKIYQNKHRIKILTSDKCQSYVPTIKKEITRGNVLVSVAEKGYANLFLCTRCRNTANCECGGKLQMQGAKSTPVCYLCKKQDSDWHCQYCGDPRPYVIAKGIDRNAEEIGRAVPLVPMLISSGSKQLTDIPNGRNLVLATVGSEPIGRYSGLILLDGERLYNRPSLRAEEFAKLKWFTSLCNVLPSGEVFVSLQNNNPVVQAMHNGDANSMAELELINRERAKLPPFYRVAVMLGSTFEISKFAENLRSTNGYQVTGPTKIDLTESKLIVRVKLDEGENLVDLLDDVSRIQGIRGRQIFKIRIDPYDL
jgi:primosomal protein N' (replication factor Y)